MFMKKRYRPILFLALALVVVLPRAASAAEIVGTAADSSGGILPAARATLHNNATGADLVIVTDANGRRGTATVGVSSRRVAVTVTATLERFDNYRAGHAAAEDTRPLFASGVLKQADTIDDAFHFTFGAFPDPFNAPFVRSSSTIPASAGQGNNINATGLFALSGTQTLQVKYIRRRMEEVGFADFNPPMFFQASGPGAECPVPRPWVLCPG
jgi:hypothetical protein